MVYGIGIAQMSGMQSTLMICNVGNCRSRVVGSMQKAMSQYRCWLFVGGRESVVGGRWYNLLLSSNVLL